MEKLIDISCEILCFVMTSFTLGIQLYCFGRISARFFSLRIQPANKRDMILVELVWSTLLLRF